MSGFGEEAVGGNINITPLFDGERFEYWNDMLKSFFISQGPKLWNLVEDGYTTPTNSDRTEISRK